MDRNGGDQMSEHDGLDIAVIGLACRFPGAHDSAMSRDLLAGYMQEPYLFFLRRNSAELIRNVTHEVSHYVTGIILPGLALVSEAIVLLFIFVMLASVDPVLALGTAALLGATAILAGCNSLAAMPPHRGKTVYASDTTVIKVRGAVRVDVAVTSD